jgi:hypothetical protein
LALAARGSLAERRGARRRDEHQTGEHRAVQFAQTTNNGGSQM